MNFVADLHNHTTASDGEYTPTELVQKAKELELTAGKGVIDFELFGQILDENGYSGEVTLEFEYRGGMTVEQIEREYDYGIAHLKSCGWVSI